MNTPAWGLLLVMGVLGAPFAKAGCPTPDKSFTTFLQRFKNDRDFKYQRVADPLAMQSTEPNEKGQMETRTRSLSLRELRQQQAVLIRGAAEKAELAMTEGRVCEARPRVRGDWARVVQSSCETDVYSDTFVFRRIEGCWHLVKMETSGA